MALLIFLLKIEQIKQKTNYQLMQQESKIHELKELNQQMIKDNTVLKQGVLIQYKVKYYIFICFREIKI